MRLRVQFLALISGLRIQHCLSCDVGHRLGSDPMLLWLWRRPAATAPIRPLAWVSPCAAGVALKERPKKKDKKKNVLFDPISHSLDSTHRNKKHQHIKLCVQKCFLQCVFFFLGPNLQHMEVPMVGVESELQLQAYTTATATPCQSHIFDLHSDLQQCQIFNPLTEARDQTHILTETTLCP